MGCIVQRLRYKCHGIVEYNGQEGYKAQGVGYKGQDGW